MSDIVFIDSETRSPVDLKKCGAYPYAHHPATDVLCWGWVFDDDVLGDVWSPDYCWSAKPDKEPTALLDHIDDGGYFVAWNAFFDRHIWNQTMPRLYGWPPVRLQQVLCAQSQAEANNLPGKLEKAAETLGVPHKKDPAGQRLISLLCTGERATWNTAHETADKMGHMRAYCVSDVLATRDIWQHTRPLTAPEWKSYHTSERINDRGVGVDHAFAAQAVTYAKAEAADLNAELLDITGDPKLTTTAHLRKAKWLFDQLWPDEELQAVVKRPAKKKKGAAADADAKPRYSADSETRALLLDALAQPEHAELFHVEHLEDVIDFLEVIEAGNSAAVAKFGAMVNTQYEGRVYGQYAHNGAGQTGRFSSRGIQVHNLIRDPVEKKNPDRALDAIDDIMAGTDAVLLVDRYKHSMSRLLARLIRPAFIAPAGRSLVWGDWAQIEARLLPWLSASPGGVRKLDLFASGADVYKHAAAPIFNIPATDIADDSTERQVGKVAELALGFGGGVGAFTAMGRGYGVYVPANDAQGIVDAWRRANQWCVDFWYELWSAALSAYARPGTWFNAGRVKYFYHAAIMHGTLICQLPSGRWLVYPQFKREPTTWEDKDGNERQGLRSSFMKGFGNGGARVDMWHGTLAENITQATGADFLTHTLNAADDANIETVLHTHDEAVAECDESDVLTVRQQLYDIMMTPPDWARDLPLEVELDSGPYYTK